MPRWKAASWYQSLNLSQEGLFVGTVVDFEVKADPPSGKAPPARGVRRRVTV